MNAVKRRAYIDVVAGLMILWMVIDHCRFISGMNIPLIKNIPVEHLLGFYMPWFYYKSGLFFYDKGQRELLKKDTSKLLHYFIVYSLVGWITWCFCGYLDHSLHSTDFLVIPIKNFIKKGTITGNGVLWFLVSLFFVRQIANIIIKKNTPPQALSGVAITSLLIAYLLYVIGWYNYSWWFGNIFTGLFFFLMGYILKRIERDKSVLIISLITYVFIVCAFYLGLLGEIPYLYMLANRMISGHFLLFFPMALAGIILVNNTFRIVEEIWGLRLFSYAEYIGKHSMNVYVTHWILLTLVLFVIKSLFTIDQLYLQFSILVITSLICLPIISMIIDRIKSKNEYLNKVL